MLTETHNHHIQTGSPLQACCLTGGVKSHFFIFVSESLAWKRNSLNSCSPCTDSERRGQGRGEFRGQHGCVHRMAGWVPGHRALSSRYPSQCTHFPDTIWASLMRFSKTVGQENYVEGFQRYLHRAARE